MLCWKFENNHVVHSFSILSWCDTVSDFYTIEKPYWNLCIVKKNPTEHCAYWRQTLLDIVHSEDKVSKGAKIRNRYNQVPHLTQDTNGKVTSSQKTPQTRAKRSALSQQVTTGTRQFTDKTIHRHSFWRQFTDRFEDSSPTVLKTVRRHFFITLLTYGSKIWLIIVKKFWWVMIWGDMLIWFAKKAIFCLSD